MVANFSPVTDNANNPPILVLSKLNPKVSGIPTKKSKSITAIESIETAVVEPSERVTEFNFTVKSRAFLGKDTKSKASKSNKPFRLIKLPNFGSKLKFIFWGIVRVVVLAKSTVVLSDADILIARFKLLPPISIPEIPTSPA